MAKSSPYADLPRDAFWRSAVAERQPGDPGNLYAPRFTIGRNHGIVTAGSCFAQHVGRALRVAGFNVLDGEPLPDWVPDDVAHRFGYRLFSGRYGNIYTVRQLRQLLEEIRGDRVPALPVWRKGDRFVDAQRPNVEPDGLADADTVLAHRRAHLDAVRGCFARADIMVFTFGLTEAWVHRKTGTVYPTAPGTIAGTHDPDVFAFHNCGVLEIYRDFIAVRRMLRQWSPGIRFVVTVSPVPLAATASGQHVEVANTYSKAVLRTACGMLCNRFADVDYFPSFEIITSQTARGAHYAADMRTVTERGVATAMSLFLRANGVAADPVAAPTTPAPGGPPRRRRRRASTAQVVCEEALLAAFAR